MLDDAFLATLRCPIDPAREATLAREGQQLVCSGCGVRFPVKQGIPILLADEAELPAGCRDLPSLPCRRQPRRH
jgi:uncharacterized protein YbaR (Trm112 family)